MKSSYQIEKCIGSMEAGARRILDGAEEVKKYQGVCRFQGFDF